MIDALRLMYATQPFLTMGALMVLTGWVTIIAGVLLLIAFEGCRHWVSGWTVIARKTNPARPSVNPFAWVVLVACGLSITVLILGCSTLGNGQVDLPFAVDVAFITEEGRALHLHQTPQGIDIVGEFIEPQTGLLFIFGEGAGRITARDPRTGLQVALIPKRSPKNNT